MLTFESIVFVALGCIAWLWYDTNRAREAGIRAARESCTREGVQLLDDTVAFRTMRFARNDKGHMALRRVYDFEYSGSGNDRYRGSVMLLGDDVVMLDVSEHRAGRLFM